MSRIGRKPIAIPKGVQVGIQGQQVEVKGPKGRLELRVHDLCSVKVTDGNVLVGRGAENRAARALHGLTRALVANMVQGVTEGFERKLEIQGIGYRVQQAGKNLTFTLGYSHPIVFPLPDGVEAKVDKQTVVTLEGPDRQVLGEAAAAIRKLRPPEPYKGKGIKYAEEKIRRKAGKAVGAAS